MKWLHIVSCTVISTLLFGCSKPQAVSSSLTADERNELKAAFSALNAVLLSKAPSIHSELLPGASTTDIQVLRAGLGGSEVESLELWFKWHNGAASPLTDIYPLGHPISIERAIEERDSISDIPFIDDYRKSAVKILDDGSGDGYFLDVASENPLVFYDMLEDPAPAYYGTLAQFLNLITEAFEKEIIYVDGDGYLDFDDAAFGTLDELRKRAMEKP